MKRYTLLFTLISIIIPNSLNAYTDKRQLVHIFSHYNTKVVTDPSTGSNPYKKWTVFPPEGVEYRAVNLYVTYRCLDSLRCGEWDYIDNIYLRRVGGADSAPRNIEIGRMISPYGWRFDSTFSFTWHVDVTDFGVLLHDSVEVEFNHTGYESNTDRGWQVTLDFEISKGQPAMTCLGMDTLWTGSFPYGNSSKPIENILMPYSFSVPHEATRARLRILQSGHGMDDLENCAEFCNKYRQIFFDDSLVDQSQIWRECGDNPLSPQAGTWIYDRAGWCPGAIVIPDVFDFSVRPHSEHSVNVDLEPYINPNTPSANYHFSAYLFYYAEPRTRNDATLETIIAPSTENEYGRMNPICSDAQIVVKNSGKRPLTSVTINYGVAGMNEDTYTWRGHIESQRSKVITLPRMVGLDEGHTSYVAALEMPNGVPDEYPADNNYRSTWVTPPSFDTVLVLALRTNADSSHTSYAITNSTGTIVAERKLGTLAANKVYYDTLLLPNDCYELIVKDSAGDGLDFWFNPEGGYGYARLLDMKGRLLKSFLSDFGSNIRFSFGTYPNSTIQNPAEMLPLVTPFPMRNPGRFTLEIFYNEPTDAVIQITTEDKSRVVFEQKYPGLKESYIPIDIFAEPDGFYFVNVITDGKAITKKIKVKHEG
ncbi:MAG: peptide-N-glycosidase F-related protein [candidate division Zixibacteria bacterium]|nr:peptide-N-glycosidase F-related protein [candidate division Zixibacteria bacterium]